MAKLDTNKSVRSVKLQNASLDDKHGEVVAHGWLDIEALEDLLVGDYQREILERSRSGKKNRLEKALEENARLPDIILGMRGEKYTTRGSSMYLEDDVYIVDGLQRVSAMRAHARNYPQEAKNLIIGAEVRFNTNRENEKELFTALNLNRTPMSPNVILRNMRDTNKGILTLYGLSNSDVNFALYGKVCWNQRMNRTEIMTALVFAKTVLRLHKGGNPTNLGGVASGLERSIADYSLADLRANAITFFGAIDEALGIRGIKYLEAATHMRQTYLVALAALMHDHENFWDGKRLVVDAKAKASIKSFALDDPTVIRLAGGGTNNVPILYNYLRDHFNKGKSVNKLVPRVVVEPKKKSAG